MNENTGIGDLKDFKPESLDQWTLHTDRHACRRALALMSSAPNGRRSAHDQLMVYIADLQPKADEIFNRGVAELAAEYETVTSEGEMPDEVLLQLYTFCNLEMARQDRLGKAGPGREVAEMFTAEMT